jgi:ribosomal-protein-alanine N-acetyltransferase
VEVNAPTLRTPRLLLRRWREEDREPYAAMNADPEVREFFPELLTRELSDAQIAVFEEHLDQHGFGMWALELIATGELLGFAGMDLATYDAHFAPAVEIGWRLRRSAWGNGYATEAARECLRFGFEELELAEIVAATAVANRRSRAVMERLGMVHDAAEDFEHPEVAAGHPLARHVLYRLRAQQWRGGAGPHAAPGAGRSIYG